MSTNRSASRIALALIAGLALTGTALARGAGPDGVRQMRFASNTPTAYSTMVAASQATSTNKSNSSAKVAQRANPTVTWSFAPSGNLYTGGA